MEGHWKKKNVKGDEMEGAQPVSKKGSQRICLQTYVKAV
jgi:hypothetical protein